MAKYTAKYVNIISLIISMIIFVFINILSFYIQNFNFINVNFKASFKVNENEEVISNQKIEQNQVNILSNIEESTKEESQVESNWYIEIPKISLKAEIAEGTSSEVMNKFVGHFEETPKSLGNVGLAAHNRGYENNYFAGLKTLIKGDEIMYKYNDFQIVYEVTKHEIIKDTDWSNLENTRKQYNNINYLCGK